MSEVRHSLILWYPGAIWVSQVLVPGLSFLEAAPEVLGQHVGHTYLYFPSVYLVGTVLFFIRGHDVVFYWQVRSDFPSIQDFSWTWHVCIYRGGT